MIKHYTLENLNLREDTLEAKLFLPMDLFYFDGHFDDAPMLPGVVQTHWAIDLACAHLDIRGEFSGIDNIKFTRIIEPKQTVDLNIMYDRTKNIIEFIYNSALGKHSSGIIRFA